MNSSVLVVIPSLGAGGAERVATLLANMWVSTGIKVSICTWLRDADRFFDVDKKIMMYETPQVAQSNPSGTEIPSSIDKLIFIRNCIKRCEPDAVLSLLPESNLFTIIASIGLKSRILISERNLISHRKRPPLINGLRFLLYRLATLVIINNRQNFNLLSKYVRPSKIIFLPNPIDPRVEEFGFVNIARRTKIVFAAGRLVAQKNYSMMLRGFAESKLGEDGWSLHIAGEGVDETQLKLLVDKLKLGEFVRFLGNEKDMWKKYHNASIFLMTSAYEGMPNALLESMRLGLVPIVTPGVGDIISDIRCVDADLCVKADDYRAVGRMLTLIAGDQSRRERVSKGMRAISQGYTVDAVAGKWNKVVWPQLKS